MKNNAKTFILAVISSLLLSAGFVQAAQKVDVSQNADSSINRATLQVDGSDVTLARGCIDR